MYHSTVFSVYCSVLRFGSTQYHPAIGVYGERLEYGNVVRTVVNGPDIFFFLIRSAMTISLKLVDFAEQLQVLEMTMKAASGMTCGKQV